MKGLCRNGQTLEEIVKGKERAREQEREASKERVSREERKRNYKRKLEIAAALRAFNKASPLPKHARDDNTGALVPAINKNIKEDGKLVSKPFSRRNTKSSIDEQKSAILATIQKLKEKCGKNSTYAKNSKILYLLGRYYRVFISERTLRYRMTEMQDDGLIKRIQRHYNRKGSGFVAKSAITYITNMGLVALRAYAKLFKFLKKTVRQNFAVNTTLPKGKERLDHQNHADFSGHRRKAPMQGMNAILGQQKLCATGALM